jgi:hypothetical protein
MFESAASVGVLLISMRSWELPHDDWRRADAALGMLEAAVAANDAVAVRRAATTLMLHAPRRAGTGLHDALRRAPQRRMPPPTRDVVDRLLERIGMPPEPERETPRDSGRAGTECRPR